MSTAGGTSTGSVCGRSGRHGGSRCQGSSEKREMRSRVFPPCVSPRAGSAPAAPLELSSWAPPQQEEGSRMGPLQGWGCHGAGLWVPLVRGAIQASR